MFESITNIAIVLGIAVLTVVMVGFYLAVTEKITGERIVIS